MLSGRGGGAVEAEGAGRVLETRLDTVEALDALILDLRQQSGGKNHGADVKIFELERHREALLHGTKSPRLELGAVDREPEAQPAAGSKSDETESSVLDGEAVHEGGRLFPSPVPFKMKGGYRYFDADTTPATVTATKTDLIDWLENVMATATGIFVHQA